MTNANVVILPYKSGSASAKVIAGALTTAVGGKVRRLYTDRPSKFVPKSRHTVINWGNSHPFFVGTAKYWNSYQSVAVAANKLLTFQALSTDAGINLPEWTDNPALAQEWSQSNNVVLARTVLSGHSGAGIVVIQPSNGELAVKAPLYTMYIKKKAEYRVHVAFGKVIDIQQKKKRSEFEGDANYLVRNHANGWVYCRENIAAPADLETQALLAVLTLGLDFGAVDIIYNEHHNKCYTLEVNTAPGCEGATVGKYCNAFVEQLANG